MPSHISPGRILVANRGECACRIMKSCSQLGFETVAVYTETDHASLHARVATTAVLVESYLDSAELVDVAVAQKATAIHPGWGFLAEDPEFAERCENRRIIFIGPTVSNMKFLAGKVAAKELARGLKIPVLPSTQSFLDVEEAISFAGEMGYPVMLKAANGGGGIGLCSCCSSVEVREKFPLAHRQVRQAFGENSLLFLEKFLEDARHIEVQVFGDGEGKVVALGERECSVQRRYQKVVEETPAPRLDPKTRYLMTEAAKKLSKAVQYKSAGTVEFLLEKHSESFYFMEFNTRLQVEHGVTELCHGVDLVAWMLWQAHGCLEENLGAASLDAWAPDSQGHAIEVRVYAEDPVRDFQPAPGVITSLDIPTESGTRVDTGVYQGYSVPPLYDPMICKLLQWAPSRSECINTLQNVLRRCKILGPPNNMELIAKVLDSAAFKEGNLSIAFLHEMAGSSSYQHCFEVLVPGTMSTVQDWPGRVRQGLWRVGVPPSGAMDHLACRIGNVLVGNEEEAAVLEMCVTGPTLKFHCKRLVAVTGAPMAVMVDGTPQAQWESFKVTPGTTISINTSEVYSVVGCRAYLSVSGGIEVPEYLGSKSTFTGEQFGGHQGRVLKAGDIIPVKSLGEHCSLPVSLERELIPQYSNKWLVGCLPGPYADPDYFMPEDVEMIHSVEWTVHHDSNRMGIRLVGPAPTWAREDGGEGGTHPSNVHDYVYSVGSVNFTGNMPIIITQDGPSLGGFVCPVTIVQSELWKVAQLRPGDTVQFTRMSIDEANSARKTQNHFIATLRKPAKESRGRGRELEVEVCQPNSKLTTKAVLLCRPCSKVHPGLTIRLSGDTYILVEYGPMVLDLNLRFRVHFLEEKLLGAKISGLRETAPGVRSLQIRYDPDTLPLPHLIKKISEIDSQLPDVSTCDISVKSRILHLPMCFNHSGVADAIQRYIRNVRKEAPYLPSNIDFIAKSNGLKGAEEVREKVFSALYMCIGLGDVYLNSPCAVPINPLHRLVIPKYSPARTYTQEGAVGLGGAYMCIYSMDSPGGYQLMGRSLPIWNTYGTTGSSQKLFSQDKPWLLEMFDQIRFFSVTEEQLEDMRLDFKNGRFPIKIEETSFDIRQYNCDMEVNAASIREYQMRQKESAAKMKKMEEEYCQCQAREKQNGLDERRQNGTAVQIQEGQSGVNASLPAAVGEVCVKVGSRVSKGDVLLYLCAMKMEFLVQSPADAFIQRVVVQPGDLVHSGDLLVILDWIQ